VEPLENGTWLVAVENTESLEVKFYTFDAIMCCVGYNESDLEKNSTYEVV